jgi:hypothetical protein
LEHQGNLPGVQLGGGVNSGNVIKSVNIGW